VPATVSQSIAPVISARPISTPQDDPGTFACTVLLCSSLRSQGKCSPNEQANLLCSTDNAVSLDGAKLLVSYLDEFAKSA
jgi:hypothetical protein